MRKVKNKKAIRTLADKSFRASRIRNVIAVIAIALTAMLFTALFTIGMGTMENFQRQTMRQSGGDSHGVIKDLTSQEYEDLKDRRIRAMSDSVGWSRQPGIFKAPCGTVVYT